MSTEKMPAGLLEEDCFSTFSSFYLGLNDGVELRLRGPLTAFPVALYIRDY